MKILLTSPVPVGDVREFERLPAPEWLSPAEVGQWEELESLREARAARRHETLEGRRRLALHLNMLQSAECWLCGGRVSPYEATHGLQFDGVCDAKCVHCGIRLHYAVPIVALAPWHWSRPATMTLAEVRDTLEKALAL